MLIIMISQRKTVFKGPFFELFKTVLIADLVCFITVSYNLKLLNLLWIKTGLILLKM